MRQIKFRAWEPQTKTMYNTDYLATNYIDMTARGEMFHTEPDVEGHIVYKFIPLQFTGLHDKNGAEIYEGDIVLTDDGMGVVSYQNDSGSFALNDCSFCLLIDEFGDCPKIEWEVIGNIYEHPELLEENHV